MEVPSAMCSLRGECETSEGAGNKAGRMLAYNPSALRSLSSPTSGRRVGWVPHLGPPTAPVRRQSQILVSPEKED